MFPPIAEDSHLVPDLILDFINSRASAPIISIDYRLRRADKVSQIALMRSHPRSDSAQGEDSTSQQTSFVDLLNKLVRGEGTADEIAALAVGAEEDGSKGENEEDRPIENAATTADDSPETLDGEVSPDARSTSSSLEVQPDQDSLSGQLRTAIQDLRSLRLEERITRYDSTVTRRNPKTGETLLHGWQIDVSCSLHSAHLTLTIAFALLFAERGLEGDAERVAGEGVVRFAFVLSLETTSCPFVRNNPWEAQMSVRMLPLALPSLLPVHARLPVQVAEGTAPRRVRSQR